MSSAAAIMFAAVAAAPAAALWIVFRLVDRRLGRIERWAKIHERADQTQDEAIEELSERTRAILDPSA